MHELWLHITDLSLSAAEAHFILTPASPLLAVLPSAVLQWRGATYPCISHSRAGREAQSLWLLSPVSLILGPEVSSSVSSEPRLKFAAFLASHKVTEKKCVSLLLCRRESNFWLHWRRLCFLTKSQQSKCCFESFSKYICSIEWTWSSVKQIYWKLFGNRHTNSFTKLVSEIEK